MSFHIKGYFFTGNIAEAWRVSEALEVGMVGVNSIKVDSPEVPFGGVKCSGLGYECGKQGLDEFTNTKVICYGGLWH